MRIMLGLLCCLVLLSVVKPALAEQDLWKPLGIYNDFPDGEQSIVDEHLVSISIVNGDIELAGSSSQVKANIHSKARRAKVVQWIKEEVKLALTNLTFNDREDDTIAVILRSTLKVRAIYPKMAVRFGENKFIVCQVTFEELEDEEIVLLPLTQLLP